MLLNFLYIYLIISYLTGFMNAFDGLKYHYKDLSPIEYVSKFKRFIVYMIYWVISPITLLLILNKLLVLIGNTRLNKD